MIILNRNLFLSLIVILFPALCHAQSASCDEGVIRLPDRSGTVVICSALASKIPNLAKQLTEATRLMGNQREQIAELTRLVRGLNGVSQGIGVERQAQMLQSLSMELTASQRGGDDKTKRAVENLSEKVEELQSQLLSALSNQSTYAATSAAIKGPIGDSIAKLELSSASRQLGEVNARLKEIQTQVGEVKNDTTAIKQDIKVVQATLSGVAKEVSDDPRKELVKRGYKVDGWGLEKAMLQKDFVALKHFNNSGYVPRYPKFPDFLFGEGWDPEVFNVLSPKILGVPKSCEDWPVISTRDYEILGNEEAKEILQNQVRVCGRERMVGKLKKSLEYKLSDPYGIKEREFADQKKELDRLRETINPKVKKPVLIPGTSMYLECNSRVEKCEYGISPEDFASKEKTYLDSLAYREASKKKWTIEVNRAIEAVKKM
jgi:hypothetical protein